MKPISNMFLGVVAIWAAISIWHITTSVAPDFSVLYRSAQNLVTGRNVYHDQTLFTGLGYPPVTLLAFLPLILLPYKLAQALWIVGSVGALIGSTMLSLRLFGKKGMGWVALFLVFASFPSRFTLGMGQGNWFALFFILISLSLIKAKPMVAGFWLFLAVLLKPHLFFLLPAFLLGASPLVSLTALGLYGIAVAGVGILYGWQHIAIYFHDVVPQLFTFAGRDIYYNQGISGMVSRLFSLEIAQGVSGAVAAGVVIVSGILTWHWRKKLLLTVAFLFVTLILIEPLSWQHHLVFLLPAFFFLFAKREDLRMLALSYVLVSINILQPGALHGWEAPILLSHATIGALILWSLFLYRYAAHRS